ncbi:MAG TPA: aldo/keto reductase, partial [Lapillicoccus sp.]
MQRLGTDHIDLYYQHRPDPDTPVEESAGALTEQIQAGKIRYYGLSEVGPELVRRRNGIGSACEKCSRIAAPPSIRTAAPAVAYGTSTTQSSAYSFGTSSKR